MSAATSSAARGRPGRRAARRDGARGGFTLLECAIAMTVLLVSLAAAFQSQLRSAQEVRSAEETHTAATDLQACLERMLTETSQALVDPDGDYAAGEPIQAFSGLHLEEERIVPDYPGLVPGEPLPNPLEIVLVLSWTDYAGRPRTMRMASMKAN